MLNLNRKPIQNRQSDQEEVTRRLLTAAEYFLRHRSFADCRDYAIRARDSDSSHPEPARILSIVSVLSAPNIASNLPDYYAILNVSRFEANAARIWSNFQTLESSLNPKVNRYPLSSEAYDLVVKAWAVLSNPSEKAKFDAELRRKLGGCTSGSEGSTFWTMCPYCYYVYEYDGAFEDCCLRCTNERCRRVLHAVAIAGTAPPLDVMERGYYWCPGFVQCASGNGDGENSWVPFDCRRVSSYSGGMASRGGNGGEVTATGSKEVKRRRKLCGRLESKKVMGRGVKLGHSVFSGKHLKVDGNEEGNLEPSFGGETRSGVGGGVEFFEGDDDVLVGLDGDLDYDATNEES